VKTEDGRRRKEDEGRRRKTKDEGRTKKEGRRKEEGRRKKSPAGPAQTSRAQVRRESGVQIPGREKSAISNSI
jgi:hypothetical protein